MEKIFFISLGCDKNLVESERMLGVLAQNGYAITYDETEADACVINTCGFIADAVKESVEAIAEMGELKACGRLKALVVTGCLVERYKDEILKEMPEADAVLNANDYAKLADVLNALLKRETPQTKTQTSDEIVQNRILTGAGYFAYLKIAEGCDNCCTYCTIWQIKGAYKSREFDSLLKEAEILAQKGVKELILVAQDTAVYGKDLYGKARLAELLRELAKICGIKWLRVLYAYPEHITDDLIEEMARNAKCCHYIDMPIQHANDRILRLMGRQSTRENLRATIAKLREAMPDIALRTTLITGFPSETEEEFNDCLRFISDIKFNALGVFEYSKEDGTKAAKMPKQIKLAEKRRRKNLLMQTQKDISANFLQTQINRSLKVIVDGQTDGAYCGRSYMNCYGIDGLVFFEADYEILSGEFVDVVVTSAGEYDLFGEIEM